MAYVDLFVGVVAATDKERYRDYAEKMAALAVTAGALSATAWWEAAEASDMPGLRLADAVAVGPGEALVARFVRWPSKAARDEGWTRIMQSPDMQAVASDIPFDRTRVRHAGFEEFGEG